MPRALDDPSLGAKYRGPPPPIILEKETEPDRDLHPASYVRYVLKKYREGYESFVAIQGRRNDAITKCLHKEDNGVLALVETEDARFRPDYVYCSVCQEFITRERAKAFGYKRP